jgi:predicted O-methyltransferase YrrM
MASENVLALLNLAAQCREPGETYLEIGTWKGLSLVGAALGNDGPFVAIEDFSMRGSNETALRDFLARIGLPCMQLCVGPARTVLSSGALWGHRIGVCYYDADHCPERQLEVLTLVRRHMADEAVIIFDDADWPAVAAAADACMQESPRTCDLLRIPGADRGGAGWWHGVRVIGVGA